MVSPEIYRMGMGGAVASVCLIAILVHWIMSRFARPPKTPEGEQTIVIQHHHSASLYACVVFAILGMIPIVRYLAIASTLSPLHH